MSVLELAYQEHGAHAALLLGVLVGVGLATTWGRVGLGLVVLTVATYGYVLGYLSYVWGRLARQNDYPQWSWGERVIAYGLLVADDATFGTVPLSVVASSLVGAFAAIAAVFATVDVLALPDWWVLGSVVLLVPLFVPVGLGRTADRYRRYQDDAAVTVTTD